MVAVFAIEPALRKSITFDSDNAFAQHAGLQTMRAMSLHSAERLHPRSIEIRERNRSQRRARRHVAKAIFANSEF
jgi:hypothetical protein